MEFLSSLTLIKIEIVMGRSRNPRSKETRRSQVKEGKKILCITVTKKFHKRKDKKKSTWTYGER